MKTTFLIFATILSSLLPAQECRVAIWQSNSNYEVSGKAYLESIDDKLVLTLSEDFASDQDPDLDLYLSESSDYGDGSSSRLLFPLKEFTGGQSYDVPEEILIDDYDYILIRCTEFNEAWGIGNFLACQDEGEPISTHTILVDNFSFSPSELQVEVGDTILWKWVEGKHTTTSAEIPAEATEWDMVIDENNLYYSYVVSQEGAYNYVCTPHLSSGMVGRFFTWEEAPSNLSNSISEHILKVFPNPANEYLSIELDVLSDESFYIKIQDLNGRLVFSETRIVQKGSPGIQLQIEAIQHGVYILSLESDTYRGYWQKLLIE